MKRIVKFGTIFTLATALLFGCSEDFLQLEPTTSLSSNGAISNVADAQTALWGVYDGLQAAAYYGRNFLLMADVPGDALKLKPANSGRFIIQFNWLTDRSNGDVAGFWNRAYLTIDRANNILNNLPNFTPPASQLNQYNQIKGEALFLRALAHFDLVRFFAMPYTYGKGGTTDVANLAVGTADGNGGHLGVPYMKTSVITQPARNTVKEVSDNIIADLTEAIPLLTIWSGSNATRVSNFAARALLAKVYLYKEDFTNAAIQADFVITNGSYTLPANPGLLTTGANPSTEAIFEVWFNDTDNNATDQLGYMYHHGGYADYWPLNHLLNSYPVGDSRLANWFYTPVGFTQVHSNKLIGRNATKPGQEVNTPVLRLAEMYLISAEAYARMATPNTTLAQDRLKVVVARGLAAEAANITQTGQALIDRIYAERRIELVLEGNNLFDLVRTRRDVVRIAPAPENLNSAVPSVTYPDYRMVYPIPQREMDSNKNMVQNSGY